MNTRAVIAWTAAAPCAIWALVRLSGVELGFPFAAMLAYTPYVLPTALVVAVVALALRQWIPAGVAGFAVLALAVLIAPRVLGGEEASASDGPSVRVLSANVLRGSGDAEQLLGEVRERRIDVLAVQELTPELIAELDRLGIGDELPHRTLEPRENVAGSGIYSRHPIDDLGTVGALTFKQSRALVMTPDADLDVTSVHPRPPTGRDEVDLWRAGIDDLPRPEDGDATQLLLGDFNATLDQPEFREVLDRGYADAADEVGEGLAATWPASDKPFQYLPVTIDHVVFERDRMLVSDFEVLELEGTDHRPVFAELVIDDG